MRSVVPWLLLAVAAAELIDEHYEEEVADEYPEEEVYYRRKRDIDPYEEHIREKRCCEDRVRRSADYVRTPRQVHQYEVHEFTDENDPSSLPYEEMLAASADHYHRVYAAPGAPKTARYLNPEVSPNVLSQNQPLRPQHQPHNQPLPHQPIHQPSPSKPGQPLTHQSVHQPLPSIPGQPLTHQPVHQPLPSHQATPNRPLPHQEIQQPLQQPSPFKAPVQFVPIVSSPVYVSHPSDVPVAVASEPVVPLSHLDGDQSPAAAGLRHKHSHGHAHAHGGGHGNHAQHHNQHGGKTSKGFSQDHFVDKGGKGHKTDELHKKEYEEALGKKKKHHDQAGHKGSHEEEAHGHRGAHFDEKKGHKKGHKTKGYHNKYHKDEFHKEHKFYDDYHKSGEHHRYGKFNAKHASNESGKKKAHHVNAGHDYVERGKKGYSNKGHVDADHAGHDGKRGHEEHHQQHSSHGKKGGKEGGSHWGYAKKN